jgi:hypothetical protein
MLNAFEETGEAFFLMLARSFLGRMENSVSVKKRRKRHFVTQVLQAVTMMSQTVTQS